jgi:paraquat-inducible protein B
MRNKASPKPWNTPKTNKTENDTVDLIDQLTQFEDFQGNILPALQKDVKAGLSTSELRKKYASLVQARIITAALANPDDSKAMAAAADLLNRVEGKATERKEVKHTLASLSEEELDAVLKSEIEDLEDMETRFDS